MAKVDAIVIGGGTIRDAALRTAAGGVECKSLIVLRGKPIIQWVAEALKASKSIGQVVVIGPPRLAETPASRIADRVLIEGSHEVENLTQGMDALAGSDRILMVAGDMPLLTPAAINDLIDNAPDADVVYPAVTEEAVLSDFPHREWVFVKTTEGRLTGSSAVLFRQQVFRDHEQTVRRVFDSRRSVGALVRMWGIGFALKFVSGRLSVADIERQIGKVLGISGRAYLSSFAELAFDVDHAPDIPIAEGKLAERG